MQFREQGRKVQCIRSTYSPETKRCSQRVVASFDRWSDNPSLAELAGLTDKEKEELAAWLAARKKKSDEIQHRTRIESAKFYLQQLAESVGSAEISEYEATAIWNGLAIVSKALRRAGHPKSKRESGACPPTGAGETPQMRAFQSA